MLLITINFIIFVNNVNESSKRMTRYKKSHKNAREEL